jgi:ATP-dependent helicase HrpB
VRNAAWLVALDVRGVEGRQAIVQLASGIEREWLTATHTERRVWVDEAGRLRAVRVRRYDALTLQEQHDVLQPQDRAVLAGVWQDAPRTSAEQQLFVRLDFANIQPDMDQVLASAAADATRLDQVDIESALPWDIRQRLLTDAPLRLPLPSGRTAALNYGENGVVRAAVKLQELFGLAETPRIGPRRTPVVFELLAPNGRPVQTTADLRSFWTTTYPEVRRELRARYPRHPWPDDPWTATATHRTIKG